ncbi:hypothetical protein ACLI4Z_16620 (plasmid) [Natrialbaceae archaeon A-arb3/5]
MQRRRVIGGVAAIAVGIAGCVDDVMEGELDGATGDGTDDDRDSSTDESNGESDESTGGDPEAAVEAFVAAVSEADLEQQAALVHEDAKGIDTADEPMDISTDTVERGDRDDVDRYSEEPESREEVALMEAGDEHAFVYAELVADEADVTGSGSREIVEPNWFVLVRDGDGGDWSIFRVFTTDGDTPAGEDSTATGEETSEQVATRIDVVSMTGTVGEDDTITTVRLVTMLSAGSDSVDLSEATVEVTSGSSTRSLTHGEASDEQIDDDALDADEFGTALIAGDDATTLSESDERLELAFDGDGLAAGDTATLTITLASGAATEVALQVPSTLHEPGSLVQL